MTNLPDELIEKATNIASGKARPEWYDVPKIIGALLERITRVEAMHQPNMYGGCTECRGTVFPCPTRADLDRATGDYL